MADYTYKQIGPENVLQETNVVHYTQNLSTSSIGVDFINIVSGSISQSYWKSLNTLFYTSGSPTLTDIINQYDKFDLRSSNFTYQNNPFNPQHVNKFHGYDSSSLFSISQHYYGYRIKPGSFQLTDKSHPSGSIIISDDGFGNLY